MPFRGDSHNFAGIHCRLYREFVAGLECVGLFRADVQPFRADMPAVFGAVVLYDNAGNSAERAFQQAFFQFVTKM